MEEQRSLQVPFDGMIGMSSLGGMVVVAACSGLTSEPKSIGKQITDIFSEVSAGEVSEHVHQAWSFMPFQNTKYVLNAIFSPPA